ncbi:ferritin-like domain-containing protein [Frankia sp. CNm7]|uniref:Ferritin-like domain-containing protein n=1 Tax=Frankia nepalensis TaxID=1836974 RepID=A0A937R913_9ACTN|nr:ferritin-like domain-containing protein [Frankia nepalensis]MBL7502829.1 ferritin-like domain-containing protein [Frankia nepalensis]MBL7515095.1 ferritin-like domain-containing protein [Frankia nepalensis]MBL7518822.1 ferritin-like domain-containing protein [Frankia nepalensis]MBL7625957.1 ferritin-like domain-containing protein [Frankia nepalensis]
MSTYPRYTAPVAPVTWDVPAAGAARFSWEYDEGRERLLALYQKGKDKQWDAGTRIDWSLDVPHGRPLGLPDEAIAIYGTPTWDKMSDANRDELRHHLASWQFSQFLHGEQGAMICSARIVESVPDLDAKFYATTQTIDESRHVEVYARFVHEKLDVVYPINEHLKVLLDQTLSDSRWDIPYLGMQVLIEGLALAAFGLLRDMTTLPLPKQILSYVMQDEARHVAFGRLALRDYYRELTDAERREREEFAAEGCYLMYERLNGAEVWSNLGLDRRESTELVMKSDYFRAFQTLLFSRIVPCMKDIGLWGPTIRSAYQKLGVLNMADVDLGAMMAADERAAEDLDRARARDAAREEAALAARRAEVAATIAAGTPAPAEPADVAEALPAIP